MSISVSLFSSFEVWNSVHIRESSCSKFGLHQISLKMKTDLKYPKSTSKSVIIKFQRILKLYEHFFVSNCYCFNNISHSVLWNMGQIIIENLSGKWNKQKVYARYSLKRSVNTKNKSFHVIGGHKRQQYSGKSVFNSSYFRPILNHPRKSMMKMAIRKRLEMGKQAQLSKVKKKTPFNREVSSKNLTD